MSMIVVCPKCQKRLKVEASAPGQRFKCPGCAAVFRVRSPFCCASRPAATAKMPQPPKRKEEAPIADGEVASPHRPGQAGATYEEATSLKPEAAPRWPTSGGEGEDTPARQQTKSGRNGHGAAAPGDDDGRRSKRKAKGSGIVVVSMLSGLAAVLLLVCSGLCAYFLFQSNSRKGVDALAGGKADADTRLANAREGGQGSAADKTGLDGKNGEQLRADTKANEGKSPPAPEQQEQLKERDQLARQAEALRVQGKYREALAPATRVVSLTRAIRGQMHAQVAKDLAWLAELYELAGEFEPAVQVRKEVLALRIKVDGEKHWQTVDTRLALAFAEKVVGLLAADRDKVISALRKEREAYRLGTQGKFAEAERAEAEVLEVYSTYVGRESPTSARALELIGRARIAQRDLRGAREANEQALAIRRQALPEGHPDTAISLNNLAVVQRNLGEYAAAKKNLEEALAIRRPALPQDDLTVAWNLFNLGNVQHDLLDDGAARKSCEEALAIRRKVLPKEHPLIADSLFYLGVVQSCLGAFATAKKCFVEVLAIRRKVLPKDHPLIADSLIDLGSGETNLGNYASAKKSSEEGLAIRRKVLPKDHPGIAQAVSNLGVVQGVSARLRSRSEEPCGGVRHLPSDLAQGAPRHCQVPDQPRVLSGGTEGICGGQEEP